MVNLAIKSVKIVLNTFGIWFISRIPLYNNSVLYKNTLIRKMVNCSNSNPVVKYYTNIMYYYIIIAMDKTGLLYCVRDNIEG